MSEQPKRIGPVYQQANITVAYAFIYGVPVIALTPDRIELLAMVYVREEELWKFVDAITGRIVPSRWLDWVQQDMRQFEWICTKTETGPAENWMHLQFVRIRCEITKNYIEPKD